MMNRFITYIKESYDELLHKVEWPERNNLIQNTVATVVGLLILTAIIFVMDGGVNTLVDFIYKI